jgi:hypothetical protein
MLALQEFVRQGDAAVPTLLESLRSDSSAERILAAQALGYLAPSIPIEPLRKAASDDDDAAVRLYAVDALGMKGVSSDEVDWSALKENEKNRDAIKHIGYTKLRDGELVKPAIVAKLRDWNSDAIDTAIVGNPAPDFELASATGEAIRLSQYRDKKASSSIGKAFCDTQNGVSNLVTGQHRTKSWRNLRGSDIQAQEG